MRFTALLALSGLSAGLVSASATANSRRSIQNLPTLTSTMQVFDDDVKALNAAIKSLDAASAAADIAKINAALLKISSDLSAQAQKLNSSGPIIIQEILNFVGSSVGKETIGIALDLYATLGDTMTTIRAKRDVFVKSGKVDGLVEGIRSQKKAVIDILSTTMTQIPEVIGSQINTLFSSVGPAPTGVSNAAAPAGLPDMSLIMALVEMGLDSMFDQTIKYLKGEQDSISLPTELLPKGMLPEGIFSMSGTTGIEGIGALAALFAGLRSKPGSAGNAAGAGAVASAAPTAPASNASAGSRSPQQMEHSHSMEGMTHNCTMKRLRRNEARAAPTLAAPAPQAV